MEQDLDQLMAERGFDGATVSGGKTFSNHSVILRNPAFVK